MEEHKKRAANLAALTKQTYRMIRMHNKELQSKITQYERTRSDLKMDMKGYKFSDDNEQCLSGRETYVVSHTV